VTDERTYQMLWDCPYCGTKKLLGVDHRHCPSCGATQDPELRYFPSDDDKVAVEDHEFTGADRTCGACGTANSAKAAHCVNCGSALDDAGAVRTRADKVSASGFEGETASDARVDFQQQKAPAQPEAPPKKKRGKLACAVGCALLLLVIAIVAALAAVLWKKPTAVEVSGHSWERAIDIEEYRAVSDSDWCDSKPSGAYSVNSERKVRSHNKVEDGEDCVTRRVDKGDGTFTEKRECTPRYREEPVYDDWCSYKVDRWTVDRTAEASGASLTDTPAWPSVKLSKTGTCKGCEREGARRETYTVHFASTTDGKTHECEFGQSAWATYAVGSRWQSKAGVLTGKLDCGALAAAP